MCQFVPSLPKMKLFALVLLSGLAAADHSAPPAPYHPPAPAPYHPPPPAPYHAPAPAYHQPAPYHPPAPKYHPEPYHEEPKNYAYGYDVNEYDEYGNPNIHSKHEERDGYTVKGQYRVQQPDCRTRIVDYYVDEYKQFHADVKFEGEICEDYTVKHYKKDPHHGGPYKAPHPAPYKAPHPAPAYKQPAPAPYHPPAPAYKPAPAPYHPPAPAPAPYHPPAPAYHQPEPYSPYNPHAF